MMMRNGSKTHTKNTVREFCDFYFYSRDMRKHFVKNVDSSPSPREMRRTQREKKMVQQKMNYLFVNRLYSSDTSEMNQQKSEEKKNR